MKVVKDFCVVELDKDGLEDLANFEQHKGIHSVT